VSSTIEKINVGQEVLTRQDQLPKVSEAGALMSVIERMATMPDLDMDRVERLFQMHEKMLDRSAESLYNDAMARAQSEIQTVVVNRENSHTGSSYADISAIHKAAKPLWTQHGFSVSSGTFAASRDGYIGVRCEVMHSGGFKKQYQDEFPLDAAGAQGKVNKTTIQAMGSTMTYARRYMEIMIFDISVGEDNDGNSMSETITPDQAAELKARLQKVQANVVAFLKYCGAKDVDSMTIKQHEKGKSMLDKKEKDRVQKT
jgi:hypothetical protein